MFASLWRNRWFVFLAAPVLALAMGLASGEPAYAHGGGHGGGGHFGGGHFGGFGGHVGGFGGHFGGVGHLGGIGRFGGFRGYGLGRGFYGGLGYRGLGYRGLGYGYGLGGFGWGYPYYGYGLGWGLGGYGLGWGLGYGLGGYGWGWPYYGYSSYGYPWYGYRYSYPSYGYGYSYPYYGYAYNDPYYGNYGNSYASPYGGYLTSYPAISSALGYTTSTSVAPVVPTPVASRTEPAMAMGQRVLGIEAKQIFEKNGQEAMRVSRVLPGTVADKAGLKPGDTIESINGYMTQVPGNLAWIINNAAPDHVLKMTVRTASDGLDHMLTGVLQR
jgi:hypothetical protein